MKKILNFFKLKSSMFKGITKRWLINTFGVVLAVIILLVVCLCVATQSICYNTVEQTLNARVNELSATYDGYMSPSTADFQQTAEAYVEDFAYKDSLEVEVINASGRVTVTSSGYEIEEGEIVPVEIFDKDEFSLIGEAV